MTQEQKVSIENVVEDVQEPTTSVAAASAIAAAAQAAGGNQGNGMSIAAASAAAQGINQAAFQKQQSAAEKKARKAMQKKGLEQVPGIANISVIRKKAPMFSINNPDVYKNASSDTWIIFGEARVENYGNKSLNSSAQRAALNAAAAASATGSAPSASSADAIETEAAPAAAVVSAEDADESGLESKDIELVMSQAGCDRPSAVKALNNNGKDVVNAIMELTA
ncbi:GAL4 enhancer protein [Coemansia sp. RSA 1933]|nr:GAL4 enhancer protein [Coemansia sp. RSA 1933]